MITLTHTHIKDPVVPVRFGRLWKHQNNPACTESVRIFEMLKMDATAEEGERTAYVHSSNV